MKTTTVTSFRSRMREHLKQIENDQDILILTGPKNSDFVVLSLDAFNAMEETAYLLSTPSNASRLMESIKQDKAGQAKERKLIPASKRMASGKSSKSKS